MQCNRIRDDVLAAEKMDVLYGEADIEVRERVAVHLRDCAACREEMEALGRLRHRLRAWTVEEHREPRVTPRHRSLPQWLLVAAVVVLAVGMGLALTSQASLRRELGMQRAQALERDRVQGQEIAALRARQVQPRDIDEEALIDSVTERLAARIRQSEQRQDRKLEVSFAEWQARAEAQRRVDLARIAAGLSYLDGRHGQQLARTNELMSYVLETASEKKAPR